MTYFLLSESCVKPKAPVGSSYRCVSSLRCLGHFQAQRSLRPPLFLVLYLSGDGRGEPADRLPVALVALRRLSFQPWISSCRCWEASSLVGALENLASLPESYVPLTAFLTHDQNGLGRNLACDEYPCSWLWVRCDQWRLNSVFLLLRLRKEVRSNPFTCSPHSYKKSHTDTENK